MSPSFVDRLRPRLELLYAERAAECLTQLMELVAERRISRPSAPWTQQDAVLITYADQVQGEGGPALPALTEFLVASGVTQTINIVHLLPFYPSSSDDGFAVIDYRRVDPAVGDWDDVSELAQHVELMFDLVLNHCSPQSDWFQGYLHGQEPYVRYFHEVDPAVDLSQVTRPRSLPLLTEFGTSRGPRHVWTTFSNDQVDLNFAEPRVLLEFMDILLLYASRGAHVIRLDAIAYLWKEIGTSCIHLPQTHEVVKLMRDILAEAAPRVWLISETNVPHAENVSYFGEGDEAHLVYQFSLPPLLLDAFLAENASCFSAWLAGLDPPPAGCTFLNFTASHDGVGVRPLEGLVSRQRFENLIAAVQQRGGLVSTRRNPDGSDSPYELNISWLDAMSKPGEEEPTLHARRMLSSQAVMLALPGIPGIYFHSLVGSGNDHAGASRSGIPRRINRRKFSLAELQGLLAPREGLPALVFQGYQHLLRTRRAQPAFHPQGPCQVVDLGDPRLLAFERCSPEEAPLQRLLCVTNLGGQRRSLPLASPAYDLLSERTINPAESFVQPWQTMWLEL